MFFSSRFRVSTTISNVRVSELRTGLFIILGSRVFFSKTPGHRSRSNTFNESELDNSKVLILSNVEVKNKANSAVMKYKLVAQSEADLKTGKISVESPIGKGLLGKEVGDVTDINVPNGSIQLEIISISRD